MMGTIEEIDLVDLQFPLDEKRFERLRKLAEKKEIPLDQYLRETIELHVDERTPGAKHDPDRLPRKEALKIYDTELTDIHRRIIMALYRYRLMTREQIARLIFEYSIDSATHRAGQYLGTLQKRGLVQINELIKRENQKVQPETRKKHFYSLTDAGMYVILAHQGKKSITRIKKIIEDKLVSPNFIDHHLESVDCAISFDTARNKEPGKLLEWDGDGMVLYKFKHKGATHKIYPDGRGIWTNGEKSYLYLMELERRHASTHDVQEKIKKYVYFFQSREFTRFEGTYQFPTILLVAKDEHKMTVLRRAVTLGTLKAHSSIPHVAPYIVFGLTLLENLQSGSPFDPIWETPLQGGAGLTFYELVPAKTVARSENA